MWIQRLRRNDTKKLWGVFSHFSSFIWKPGSFFGVREMFLKVADWSGPLFIEISMVIFRLSAALSTLNSRAIMQLRGCEPPWPNEPEPASEE